MLRQEHLIAEDDDDNDRDCHIPHPNNGDVVASAATNSGAAIPTSGNSASRQIRGRERESGLRERRETKRKRGEKGQIGAEREQIERESGECGILPSRGRRAADNER